MHFLRKIVRFYTFLYHFEQKPKSSSYLCTRFRQNNANLRKFWDNTERINNTIKNEFFANLTFFSIEDVKKAVADAVDFYNTKRPHLSLDMHTPEEAAQMTGEINKLWYSYREKAIKRAINLEESEKSVTFAAAS